MAEEIKQNLPSKEPLDANARKQALVHIHVDWQGAADSVPVRHANQVTVQVNQRDLLLSFFMMVLPIVLGTPEEVLKEPVVLHQLFF